MRAGSDESGSLDFGGAVFEFFPLSKPEVPALAAVPDVDGAVTVVTTFFLV